MKKIGIVGWKVSDNSFGITTAYYNWLSYFGNVTVIMPNETEVREDLDVIVLPGGPDVDTSRYIGEEALNINVGKPCPFRERFDRVLLPKYIQKRIPLFGICRGHQSLAVHFGGTLKQHMGHENNPSHDRGKLVHKVSFTGEGKELLKDLGFVNSDFTNYQINSIHHQSVDVIPINSVEICYHKEDFNNEALAYTNYPCYSTQYHPEEIVNDKIANTLLEELLQVGIGGVTKAMAIDESITTNM